MKKEKGFGIIAAVFVILILSMLTIFSVSLLSSDIEIALDSLRSAQALYICEGAMEFCIRFELKDDDDWSNNADRVGIPMDTGTISIYYDPATTPTRTRVRVVTTVDDVTRKVACGFHRGWPERYEDFPQSVYTKDDLTINSSPNISIETPFETNNNNIYPNITCDFSYYASNATETKLYGWSVDEASDQTYTGIIYVYGSAIFNECTNITINGTLVATYDICFNGCTGVTLNPSGNNPALVAGNDIKFQYGTGSTQNVDIRGMVYAGDDVLITDCENFSMTSILYAADYVDVLKTNDFQIDGSIISHNEITFNTCGGTGPDINWGSKVLSRSPGFTWVGGSFVKGTWAEAY